MRRWWTGDGLPATTVVYPRPPQFAGPLVCDRDVIEGAGRMPSVMLGAAGGVEAAERLLISPTEADGDYEDSDDLQDLRR